MPSIHPVSVLPIAATSAFRAVPWLAVMLVGAVSLVPGWLRPHTGLPSPTEHFVAYILTGFALATQARSMAHRLAVVALLGLYAGSLEILQNFVPDRGPKISDFLVSSAGAFCGVTSFALIQFLHQRRAGK
jgi:hypothetical protein